MSGLNQRERDCLQRYCDLLRVRLNGRLMEVRMFGSASRGDMWPANSPMHSDIDLLVITSDRVSELQREELLNETYPLFLECGRQLSPHFYTERQLAEPPDERTRRFLRDVAIDLRVVWPPGEVAGG
jgi:predicted nucleotidyltransferase